MEHGLPQENGTATSWNRELNHPLQNIPRSGLATSNLIGREEKLIELHHQLQRKDFVSISGMTGVGKTELAIQYAWQQLQEYPGGIFWLEGRGESLGNQIVEIAADPPFNVLIPKNLKTIEEQINHFFQVWNPNEKVLFILDNISSLSDIKQVARRIPRILKILITTQIRNLDASFNEFHLEELPLSSAIEFLKEIIGNRVDNELSEAEEICRDLGCLPLGLELIGRYLLDDPDLTLKEMSERLNAQSIMDESLDLNEGELDEKYWMTAKRGIRASCELIWGKLDEITQYCAQLIGIFGLYEFPWKLLELASEHLEFSVKDSNDAKKNLYRLNLLKSNGVGYYRVHEVVREFFRIKATHSEESIRLKVFGAIGLNKLSASYYLEDNLSEYRLDNNPEKAISLSRRVIEIRQEVLPEGHPDLIDAVNNLGLLLCSHNSDNEAEKLLWDALIARRKNIAFDYSSLSNSYRNLGVLYRYHNKPELAQHFYEMAGNIRLKCFNRLSLSLAEILKDLGDCYFHESLNALDSNQLNLGKFTAGASFYIDAFETYKQLLGLSHKRTVLPRRGVEQYLLLIAFFLKQESIHINDEELSIVNRLWQQLGFKETFSNYLEGTITYKAPSLFKNSFKKPDCKFTDFSFADLRNVCITDIDLRGSSFFCANLNNSTIKNADLRDADFIGAQLNDVILENVILKNSDLSFAVSNKLSICKSDTHDFLRLYPQLQIEFSEGTLVLSVSDELKSFRVTGIPVGTFEPSSGIYYQTLGRFDSA